MQESVLTLGERIVLAARLAAIEHVRREMEAAESASTSRIDLDRPGSPAALHRKLADVFHRALAGELGAA